MMLDQFQNEAVTHRDGPCMVLAGPGSGKTTVIVNRIRALIESGVPSGEILVITFTRAAAMEMQKRYQTSFGPECGSVTFGTFHSIFFHILTKHYRLNAQSILDAKTRIRIFRDILQKSGIKQELTGDEFEAVALEISSVKCGKYSPEAFQSSVFSKENFLKIYHGYNESLRSNKLIDFDDMVILVLGLFKNHPDILKRWQNTYRYFLIDEFQDIARNQYEAMRLFALPDNNLFIVGDDDQSIYGFRGASPEIMLGFPSDYPGCKIVNLKTNYRSTSKIVKGACNLISHNEDRFQKDIVSFNKAECCDIHVLSFDNTLQENEFILSRIEEYHDSGIKYSDMAVLCRTNSRMHKPVPVSKSEVAKDITAYLKIAAGLAERGDFLRVMNRPYRGILRQAVEAEDNIFDEMLRYYSTDARMQQTILHWRRSCELAGGLTPFAAINFIKNALGYQKYMEECTEAEKRESSLLQMERLLEMAKGEKTITRFLELIASCDEKSDKEVSGIKDEVNIMTMHGSKGLEFEVVFLPQSNETVIPNLKEKTRETLEEERRLYYVAMTRAKKELYITYVNKKADRELPASRFIAELSAPQSEHKECGAKQSCRQDA